MGAAVGDGPGAMTRVAAGLAGPVAPRRLVACSGPVRTSERCLLGDRSDQRPIEVVDALADVRGRIEPLLMALRRDLIMRNSPRGPQRNAVHGVYRWRASIWWRLCATTMEAAGDAA